MDAAGLLELVAGFECGLEAVERAGRGGEETEGIVVGAGDGAGLDEGVDLFLWKSQRGEGGMADFLGAVNHGPFVQAVAGEVGGS